MAGIVRKDKDGKRITHFVLLENDDVRRWYENLGAKSGMTAKVYLRGLGFYCDRMKTNPKHILEDARMIKPLQDQFIDFVRGMEREGKAGAYIARYKKVLHSWTKYNGIEFKSIANIKNESINERTQNETVPSQEDLANVLRHAGLRGRVEISLIAYSGLRPRSISNEDGSDCLRLGDIPELKIKDGTFIFERTPVRIKVKATLNKGQKHAYSTFMGEEGVTYLKEYLEYRSSEGEHITLDSPIIQYDRNVKRKHTFIPTFYIEREIRDAIVDAGFYELKVNEKGEEIKFPTKRPYVLRAYFATAMGISEQKGLISHPWRQYFMGHSGDMESRYSTNKELPENIIEEVRSAYGKCLKFLETEKKGISEEDKESIEKTLTGTVLKKVFGFSDKEIEDMISLSDDELQKKIKEKKGMILNNGHKQKVIPMKEVKHYVQDLGWEYVTTLGNEAIVRVPGN